MSTTIRYTKGFLLDLKKRLQFIESAHGLLEAKRDHLINELGKRLEVLKEMRREIVEEISRLMRELASIHATYGSSEFEAASALLTRKAQVEIIPKSILGVLVPLIKKVDIQSRGESYPTYLAPLAEKASNVLRDLIMLAGLEAEIELMLEDLRNTNIRVNALEKVIIPHYVALIKKIQDILDHEMIQEFVRMKLVKRALGAGRASP